MTDKHDLNGYKQANEKDQGIIMSYNCYFIRGEKALNNHFQNGKPYKTISS